MFLNFVLYTEWECKKMKDSTDLLLINVFGSNQKKTGVKSYLKI